MKRKIILFLMLLSSMSTTVQAATVDDILPKFGIQVEANNSAELYKDLLAKYSVYKQLRVTKEKRDNFLNFAAEAEKMRAQKVSDFDVDALYEEMQDKLKYLTTLVEVDADLDKIFDAEDEYRQAKAEYETCITLLASYNKVKEFDIDSIIADVTDEYNQASESLNNAKALIRSIKEKANLGTLTNLQYPVKNSSVDIPFGNQKVGDKIIRYHGLRYKFADTKEVSAVLSGKVIATGHTDKLYDYVIVAQSEDMVMLYGYLQSVTVSPGDVVSQYSKLGYATNNVHMAIYINGICVDPSLLYT